MKLIDMEDRQPGVWLEAAAREHPDRIFLIFPAEGVKITYGEALDTGLRHAAFLRDEAGLALGDNIAMMLPNGSDWVRTWFGSLLAGMTDVGVHHDLSGLLLAHQLRVSRAKAAVCEAQTAAKIVKAASNAEGLSLKTIVLAGAPDAALRDAAAAAGLKIVDLRGAVRHAPAARVERDPRDLMSIRFTSGTTGPAKASTLTVSQVAVWADYLVQLLGFREDDRIYAPYPLHHHLASIMGVMGALRARGASIIDRQFSAGRFWATCIANDATLGLILDPVVNILYSAPPSPRDRAHKVRGFYIARPHKEFEARFNTRLQTAYALTEANVLTYIPEGRDTGAPNSIGIVNPHYEVRIVDENDEELPPNMKGEIVFRPRHPYTTMISYFEDPANMMKACRNLWFHTGDLGMANEEGHMFFFERMGDTIRRRGVNIPSFHIEEAALAFPSVAEAVAVAVPATVGEFEIKLLVTPKAGQTISLEELTRFLCEHLPLEMVPRFMETRERFNRTITEKIIKHELKKEGITPDTVSTEGWLKY